MRVVAGNTDHNCHPSRGWESCGEGSTHCGANNGGSVERKARRTNCRANKGGPDRTARATGFGRGPQENTDPTVVRCGYMAASEGTRPSSEKSGASTR
ncbi:hypothetical protein GCM10011313_22070 [Mycetocola zhadangensis]|nr:hypothetical protein GCM10011313_22070 [Mycetocola zhadangensis]